MSELDEVDARRERLSHRTARSMVVAYSSYVGGRLLVLVSTAILAHLLAPRQFGLVALALLAGSVLDGIANFGIAESLVIAPDEELEARSQTAWRMSMAVGTLVAVVIAALSPVVSQFFHQPGLRDLLLLVALNFVVRSLGDTHYALAQRSLNFGLRAGAELTEVVVRGITSIILALCGLGAMSLMLGYLAGVIARTIVLWVGVPFRPRRGHARTGAGVMLRFGGKLTALEVIGTVFYNVDNAVVGKLLGAAALGLYSLGYRMPELLVYNLAVVAQEVLYPAFAAAHRDSLERAFLLSLRFLLVVGLPMAMGLAVLARPFVETLFGHQWEHAVPVMQVLAALALCGVLGIPAGTIYKATNRVGVLIALSVPRALIVLPGLVLFGRHGIVSVAAVMTAGALVAALIGIVLASRLVGVGLRAIGEAATPAVLATIPTTVVVMAVAHAAADSNLVALAASGLLGTVTYLAALRVASPSTVSYALSRLRG